MDSQTTITAVRCCCGAAVLIASMVTGENGIYQMIALLLMGLPIERLQPKKKEETE